MSAKSEKSWYRVQSDNSKNVHLVENYLARPYQQNRVNNNKTMREHDIKAAVLAHLVFSLMIIL